MPRNIKLVITQINKRWHYFVIYKMPHFVYWEQSGKKQGKDKLLQFKN
jgi:hypothetical protein